MNGRAGVDGRAAMGERRRRQRARANDTGLSDHHRRRRSRARFSASILRAVPIRRDTRRRAIRPIAPAARARADANSGDPRLSLPDAIHHLSGSLHLRVPGPGPRAPMHLLARGGKSPERSGHRSQDALLVAARTRSPPLTRAQFHSRTSTKCPAIAAAAAIAGDTRWVRPLYPWRPSKLRFEVEAQRSPGESLSGFMARHMEQPGSRHSKPALRQILSSPSASACSFTKPEPGTIIALTLGLTLLPSTTRATTRHS